ncbi:MAG: B12-binding domain-containing radical SAM protein [Deltaproteobacteria bacterium]|nr:B12-binding domain-containing radical SAM protein [Deltaproteobacteria bacterium]
MKIVLVSMPDVAPVIMHESAFHMPNLGLASLAANLEDGHDVRIVDLIRKRRNVRRYLSRVLLRFHPQVVGLSSMTWQYATCEKLIKLIRQLLPEVKIVLGGYHATLMYKEIGESQNGQRIDFLVRGEGEDAFRRLIMALEGKDRVEEIPSVSYQTADGFVHTPRGELLDLKTLKLPVRDKRRLTWGYHIMNRSAEVIETSRGCLNNCNFCSIRHMYGRAFRAFPIERVLADIDAIYYGRRVRWIFVSDDNFVMIPDRVIELCDAIIARNYRNLMLVVQADCVTMSRNEKMVRKMSKAGFKSIFLGIENVSRKNLQTAKKGDIVDASRKAIALCHKYGMMVIAGMIFGFPEDGEQEIMDNYRFLKSTGADTAYCQILTPYPKTGIRQVLLDQGLVTNPYDYTRYNGMWANVKTRHLSSDTLEYLVWYHHQNILGWWEPSERMRQQSRLWTSIWRYGFRPLMRIVVKRAQRKYGWQGRFEREIAARKTLNRFQDLDEFA